MTTVSVRKARPKLVILNSTDEAILRAVYEMHNVTAQDITRLLFSKGSLTHVRSLLSRLAGDADHITNSYLYRFQLPTAATGNREKVYALGAKGRDFLMWEAGLPLDYYRPYKLRHFSYSHILHHLTLTRFVVAAHYWCRNQGDVRLVQTRLCYELARALARVPLDKEVKKTTLPVPDAWLLFERSDGKKYPIWLEIDCGSKHSLRLKRDLHNRIEFIRSGEYKKMFQTDAVLIAYVTTGERPEYRETRRHAMCAWTSEVLKELGKENWSHIFRFTSVVFDEIYTTPLFDEPIWCCLDSPTPVPLFTP
jgi:Replication-relaxation